MTKEHGAQTNVIAAGIEALLADDRRGKRTKRWLARRSHIAWSTFQARLAAGGGGFTVDQMFRIADTLEVDVRDIIEAGAQSVEPEQAAA